MSKTKKLILILGNYNLHLHQIQLEYEHMSFICRSQVQRYVMPGHSSCRDEAGPAQAGLVRTNNR